LYKKEGNPEVFLSVNTNLEDINDTLYTFIINNSAIGQIHSYEKNVQPIDSLSGKNITILENDEYVFKKIFITNESDDLGGSSKRKINKNNKTKRMKKLKSKMTKYKGRQYKNKTIRYKHKRNKNTLHKI
jgi:hypothetical protein